MPLALVLPVRFHLILRHPCTLLPVARLPVVVVVVVAAAARVVRVHLHLDQVLFILSPAPHGRRLYLQVLVDRAHAPIALTHLAFPRFCVPLCCLAGILMGPFGRKIWKFPRAACPALFFWRRGEKPRRDGGRVQRVRDEGRPLRRNSLPLRGVVTRSIRPSTKPTSYPQGRRTPEVG